MAGKMDKDQSLKEEEKEEKEDRTDGRLEV
jgi:hypothetical protein